MTRPDPNTLYRAAQVFIREGQPVFPCWPDGDRAKAPMTRNGLKDASLNVAQAKAWWKRNGASCIGIPTGIKYDVLDVDIKENADGRVHLPYLQRLGLLEGCVKVVRTPSGGWHLYFPATPGLTNKARGATLGLDVRGKGGYVLAPPSYVVNVPKHDGGRYSGPYIDVGETQGGTPGPLYWDLIVSALIPVNDAGKPLEDKFLLPSERRSSLANLREWVSIREPGERNNALHWAVCRCIDNGLDPHELVEPALLSGLGEDEIMLTIGSALKRAGVNADDLLSETESMFPDDE